MMPNDHSLDLPYDRIKGGDELHDPAQLVSSGIVLLAAAVNVAEPPDKQLQPALVFRFAKPDGSGFYPPMVLVMEDDQMAKLRPLVASCIHDAREAAKQ